MDCTHQPMHKHNPEPIPEPTPAAAALPQEATGDSESDVAVSVLSADRLSAEDDDAESCSGGGGGDGSGYASANDVDGDEDDVIVESDVDSKMAVPSWRRHSMVVEDAADKGISGCAPVVATEGGAVVGSGHAAESNRLFWEACIAHGY